MSTPRRVAVAGGSGILGRIIVKSLLDHKNQFEKIIVLTRTPDAEGLDEFKKRGAIVRAYEEPLAESFADVHVLINTINNKAAKFRDEIADAIIDHTVSNVKLYIPSEFGNDHTAQQYDHPEWESKRRHEHILCSRPYVRICRIFVGMFLEQCIGPWFGFDVANGKYEAVGSADEPISYTGMEDIGRTVTSIVAMPYPLVPKSVHIGGDTKTFNQVVALLAKERGDNLERVRESVTVLEKKAFKQEKLQRGNMEKVKMIFGTVTEDFMAYIRVLMGEGQFNHEKDGLGNDNEMVNPSGVLWTWKTVEDYAKEVKGRPFCD